MEKNDGEGGKRNGSELAKGLERVKRRGSREEECRVYLK